MALNNPYNAYVKTGISTASQGRLVVLLYEGAVKQLAMATSYFEADNSMKAGNIEAFGKAISKARSIITELQVSLDLEKGGEIAKNLMSLYIFFNEELMSASIARDKAKIESVHKMMKDLLGSWKSIAETTDAPRPTEKIISIES